MNFIDILAFRLFGRKILEHEDKFVHLKVTLRKARIEVPVEQYCATAILYSLLAGIAGGFAGILLGMELFKGITTKDIVLALHISKRFKLPYDAPTFFGAHLPLIFTILAGIFFFVLLCALTYGLIMAVPPMKASTRRTAINQTMPHATAYLYVMNRGGGMPIFEVMRSLSEHVHLYGMTAKDFGLIIRDTECFGKDLLEALFAANDRSPSEHFKDFIDGLISIISSGGDITRYLKDKTEFYKANANKEHKRFLETLGLLAEVYITVFVVGPLFMMVILVVMILMDGSKGSGNLYLLVYGAIPFGTAIFLIILDMLTGDVEKMPEEQISREKPDSYSDVRAKPATEEDLERIKKIEFFEKFSRIRHTLLHPIQKMKEKPVYAFSVSGPLAAGYLYFSFTQHRPAGTDFLTVAGTLDNFLYFSLLILFIPYIIFHELEVRKINMIEEEVPEFLKRLASINGTGILLADAISITAQSNIGKLKPEIKRMVADLTWNSNLVGALKRFEKRIQTNLTRRSMTLIAKASESTGDIHSVISIVADDADIQKQLKKERSAEMFIYVFILYVTFFVFLIIVYVLAAYFLPTLTSSGGSNPAMSMASFNLEEYTLLFFHAALLQGIGSGLITGKMGSGNLSSGLKHSVAMMTISFVLFTVFI